MLSQYIHTQRFKWMEFAELSTEYALYGVRCTQRNFLSLESVQNMHILRKAHDDDADTYTHLCNTHRSIVSVCVCIEMTTLQYTKSILLSLSYTVCHCVRVFMSYCGADFFYLHRMYLNFLFTFAY